MLLLFHHCLFRVVFTFGVDACTHATQHLHFLSLSGLEVCVFQQFPCLVAGWRGGTSYCMHRSTGGIVKSLRVQQYFPPIRSWGPREWGRARDPESLNDCSSFLMQHCGNSAEWQVTAETTRGQRHTVVPFFLPSGDNHTPPCAHGHQGFGGGGGLNCDVYTATKSDLNMVSSLEF